MDVAAVPGARTRGCVSASRSTGSAASSCDGLAKTEGSEARSRPACRLPRGTARRTSCPPSRSSTFASAGQRSARANCSGSPGNKSTSTSVPRGHAVPAAQQDRHHELHRGRVVGDTRSIPQARRPARVLRPLLHLQKKSPVPGSESGLDLRLWSPVTESNRRPSPYHGDALPTELTGPTYYGVAP